jgi:hypothetical protein
MSYMVLKLLQLIFYILSTQYFRMKSDEMLPVAGAVVFGFIGLYYLKKYFGGGICNSKERLDGKTVLITGCNVGIGRETVLDMCRRGARVAMLCRSLEKAKEAAEYVRQQVEGADIVLYRQV